MTTDQPNVELRRKIDDIITDMIASINSNPNTSNYIRPSEEEAIGEMRAALHSMLIEAENRGKASCDIAADQPNDVHIGYFNKGFEAGVRKCREAIGEDESISVIAGREYDLNELAVQLEPIKIRNDLRAEQRQRLQHQLSVAMREDKHE